MTLIFLLEEPSARALLEGLLPRLLPSVHDIRYVVFEGKQDLEKSLVRRLRGWLAPDSKFVVMRDQDGGDCIKVKRKLQMLVAESGRTALVRIACRELESWVLGDLAALGMAFSNPRLASQAPRAKFREPDALGNPLQELRSLVPSYQKIDGARRMGVLLDPERNSSASFQVFCTGVLELAGS